MPWWEMVGIVGGWIALFGVCLSIISNTLTP